MIKIVGTDSDGSSESESEVIKVLPVRRGAQSNDNGLLIINEGSNFCKFYYLIIIQFF